MEEALKKKEEMLENYYEVHILDTKKEGKGKKLKGNVLNNSIINFGNWNS